jgi:hypothetical protein
MPTLKHQGFDFVRDTQAHKLRRVVRVRTYEHISGFLLEVYFSEVRFEGILL